MSADHSREPLPPLPYQARPPAEDALRSRLERLALQRTSGIVVLEGPRGSGRKRLLGETLHASPALRASPVVAARFSEYAEVLELRPAALLRRVASVDDEHGAGPGLERADTAVEVVDAGSVLAGAEPTATLLLAALKLVVKSARLHASLRRAAAAVRVRLRGGSPDLAFMRAVDIAREQAHGALVLVLDGWERVRDPDARLLVHETLAHCRRTDGPRMAPLLACFVLDTAAVADADVDPKLGTRLREELQTLNGEMGEDAECRVELPPPGRDLFDGLLRSRYAVGAVDGPVLDLLDGYAGGDWRRFDEGLSLLEADRALEMAGGVLRLAPGTVGARTVDALLGALLPAGTEGLALLQAAAIQGSEFTEEVVAAVVGRQRTEVGERLEALAAAARARGRPSPVEEVAALLLDAETGRSVTRWRFAHPVLADHLCGLLHAAERERLAEATEQALAEVYAAHLSLVGGALVRTQELRGHAELASRFRVLYRRRDRRMRDLRRVVRWYRAGEIQPSPRVVFVLIDLARADMNAGRYLSALSQVREAAAMARATIRAPEQKAFAFTEMCDLWSSLGRLDPAGEEALLEETLRVAANTRFRQKAEHIRDSRRFGRMEITLEEMRARTIRLAQEASDAGNEAVAQDLWSFLVPQLDHTELDLAESILERLSGRAVEEPYSLVLWNAHRGMVANARGRPAEAAGWFERALELQTRRIDGPARRTTFLMAGFAAYAARKAGDGELLKLAWGVGLPLLYELAPVDPVYASAAATLAFRLAAASYGSGDAPTGFLWHAPGLAGWVEALPHGPFLAILLIGTAAEAGDWSMAARALGFLDRLRPQAEEPAPPGAEERVGIWTFVSRLEEHVHLRRPFRLRVEDRPEAESLLLGVLSMVDVHLEAPGEPGTFTLRSVVV